MNQRLRLFLADLLSGLGFPRSIVGKVAGLTPRQIHIAAARAKMSKRLWWDTLDRFDYTCQARGRRAPEVKLHVEHLTPLALSGRTVESNLTVLCADCNLSQSTKLPRRLR
jgi:5-methylcytosine-specific restriction endonuclease McrA